ncbi:MAG: DUF4062 domain-containing protein [Gammaproteobacteria bacterium]|nr:DUF4062 domain-containing protein [Gammaproteobacteria bacterium]
MARKKVYISSTSKDLGEHRSALKATLERAGFDVECMENYPAFDERPRDKCLADVAECDYYVLILAWRYGFQPEDDNPRRLSITHLEYEKAVRLKKPCLAFLLDPEHAWPPGRIDPNALSPRSKIGRFRQTVETAHGRRFFTTPDSLAAAVLEPLREEEQKHLSDGEKAKAQIREAYLDWLRRSCESVDLLGLDLKESQNVRLGQAYVPAVATGKAGSGEPESLREGRHTLLLHRLGEESLYVPGAPGSGKTTFCRWLALLAAGGTLPAHPIPAPKGFRETLPDALRGRFPLLCRLREWAGREECLSGKGHWTRAQLEDSLSGWLDHTRPGGLTAAVFREQLTDGRCLLILDGVDELPQALPGVHLAAQLHHRPGRRAAGLAEARPSGLAHEQALRSPRRRPPPAPAHRGGTGGAARSPAGHLHPPLVRRRRSAQGPGKGRGAFEPSGGAGGPRRAPPEPHAAHRPLRHVGPGPEAAAGFLPALRCGVGPGALQAVCDGERPGPGAVPAGGRRPRDAPRALRRKDHPERRGGHRGNRSPSGGLQPERRGDRERRRRRRRAAGRPLVQFGALVAAGRRPGGVLPSQLPGIPGRRAAPAHRRQARGPVAAPCPRLCAPPRT